MRLHDYLASAAVPGIAGVDTRAITRRIRHEGVMMGMIVPGDQVEAARQRLAELPAYDAQDFIDVGVDQPYSWVDGRPQAFSNGAAEPGPHIVVLDEGLKYNILRNLRRRGCRVTAMPPSSGVEDILSVNPDGVLLSPGPGDPQLREFQVQTATSLIGKLPIMGICMGHQVLGRAFGADTFKLKFGHRGGNHPVLEVPTGRIAITAQNHGYAVDPHGLSPDVEVTHINLHDETVDRTTDGTGPVREMTWDEVRQLDAGYRFRDSAGEFPYRGRGVRIPLFDEVLEELPHMRIMVEPKSAQAARPPVEVIRARGAEHRILTGAMFERTRVAARDYGGPRGASRSQVMPFWLLHRIPVIGRWYVPAVDAFQVPETWGRYRVVTPGFVRAAHRANIPVHVWTVDDPADMRRLLEWGVDGIQTDRPDLLSDVLAEVVGRPPPPGRVGGGGR